MILNASKWPLDSESKAIVCARLKINFRKPPPVFFKFLFWLLRRNQPKIFTKLFQLLGDGLFIVTTLLVLGLIKFRRHMQRLHILKNGRESLMKLWSSQRARYICQTFALPFYELGVTAGLKWIPLIY